MSINYVMVFVSDMKRSIAFYRDSVGLPLRFESPEWTEFATEGATLALHATGGPSTDLSSSAQGRAGSCRPGFRFPDLDAFHRKTVATGVRCVQEPKEVFGARVAQYSDPDGLVFSVGEEPGRPTRS
jgi:catechol 2,3-dioxygenase-like lactoylglutathione lyase family enzyme